VVAGMGRRRAARGAGMTTAAHGSGSWQHPWQHPDRAMRPYRPGDHTIWTPAHDLDGPTLSRARLRAWSRLTGWRFESSSAHEKALLSGAFALSLGRCRTRRRARGNILGNIRSATSATGYGVLATASRPTQQRSGRRARGLRLLPSWKGSSDAPTARIHAKRTCGAPRTARHPPARSSARSVATSVATSRSSDASISSTRADDLTLLHDLDGSTLSRARLRAWSGITGWRFESSSAHEKALLAGPLLSL
jgi:hypothetical protein